MSGTLRFFDADEVVAGLSPRRAVAALSGALRGGLDVERDSPRLFSALREGEFLLMPAETPEAAGVKVLTVAPGNPAKDLPKIQGHYLLFHAETLAPRALVEGTSLTLVRTSAVTTLAVSALRAGTPVPRLLVFGSGPQAHAHVVSLAECLGVGEVAIAGRTPERAAPLIGRLRTEGIDARTAADDDVERADVIVCASSSSTPLFDGARVRDEAVVAAIGTHGLDAREVDETLVRRADVAVEARASARRESGNLLQAAPASYWEENPPWNLAELARGEFTRTPGRPALYSAVGMAWEDLVLAAALADG